MPLRLVDLGGGLGIPYEVHEDPLDLQRLGHGLAALIDGWSGDPSMAEARLLVEPGRWLVGPAGAYLSRVVDRKTVGGEHVVVILDGGVHHVLRPALVGTDHVLRALPRAPRRAGDPSGGPDLPGHGRRTAVFRARRLRAARRARRAGCRRPGRGPGRRRVRLHRIDAAVPVPAIPPEVAIRRGRAELIRPRQEPAEWLERQRVPAW